MKMAGLPATVSQWTVVKSGGRGTKSISQSYRNFSGVRSRDYTWLELNMSAQDKQQRAQE